MYTILHGDVLDQLGTLANNSVHCVVTSPPYYGLRDYGHAKQLGLEKTPEAFVESLVTVFREVRRVLRPDGTVWLNLGDSYHAKDLLMIPARVALALQADWYLRADIIWSKPNPKPESAKDRPSAAHEHIFLLTKSPRYYYDAAAIAEPVSEAMQKQVRDGYSGMGAKDYAGAKAENPSSLKTRIIANARKMGGILLRNKRSVWTVTTQSFKGAHFAVFPEKLVTPCILAGSPVGGIVLDLFMGSGTTGVVALRHDRAFIGIDLNSDYIALARQRIDASLPEPALF